MRGAVLIVRLPYDLADMDPAVFDDPDFAAWSEQLGRADWLDLLGAPAREVRQAEYRADELRRGILHRMAEVERHGELVGVLGLIASRLDVLERIELLLDQSRLRPQDDVAETYDDEELDRQARDVCATLRRGSRNRSR